MLKILVDAHVFDEAYFQGTTSYIRGLYKDNDSMDITYAAHDVRRIKKIFGADVKTAKLYFKSRFGRLLIDFPRLFLRGDFDLVHFQYVTSPLLYRHSIVTIHDVLFKDYKRFFPGLGWKLKDLLYRISYKQSKFVLTVSDYSRERLYRHYGWRDIVVTENMFERNTDVKINPGINQKFILLVSRDEDRKRLDIVEKLLRSNNDLKFVLVTNSDRFNLYPQVTTYSSLEQAQLNWLYENCHFSIFPSMCEGFGMPIIESLLSGRTVLARRASAMATLKIPVECFFDSDNELISKVTLLWNKTFEENSIIFDSYNDWTPPQKELIKYLKNDKLELY